jgi:hypothetical protein
MEEKNDNKEENFIKDGVIEIDPDIGLKPDKVQYLIKRQQIKVTQLMNILVEDFL